MPPLAPVVSEKFVHIEETFIQDGDGTIYSLGQFPKGSFTLLPVGLDTGGSPAAIGADTYTIKALGSNDRVHWTEIFSVTEANEKTHVGASSTNPFFYLMLSAEGVSLDAFASIRANLLGV